MNITEKIEYEGAIRTLQRHAEGMDDNEVRKAIGIVADAAKFVSRAPMACYKSDLDNESPCEHSRFNLYTGRAECTHPCVIQADKARMKAEAAQDSAERKLKQYREAVRPILDNCRNIIRAVEGDENGAEVAQ